MHFRLRQRQSGRDLRDGGVGDMTERLLNRVEDREQGSLKPKMGLKQFLEDASSDLLGAVKAASRANVRKIITSTASGTTVACDAPTGMVADTTDCDDLNAYVNPAATEICDGGVDNDCDGLDDDDDPSVSDRSTWFADDDGDSYGGSSSAEACDAPSGYVADSTDCDDSDATVNPGATEVCDSANLDEDCDGKADDADSAASGKSTAYRDADGDTYGNSSSATTE